MLFVLGLRSTRCEEITGIQRLVAVELEDRSVQLVRSALGDDVDHAARCAPQLRRKRVGFHPHLLDRIHRRADDDGADEPLVVVEPVDQEVVQ